MAGAVTVAVCRDDGVEQEVSASVPVSNSRWRRVIEVREGDGRNIVVEELLRHFFTHRVFCAPHASDNLVTFSSL